jgi:hypothetical protein
MLRFVRFLALFLSVSLVAYGCGSDGGGTDNGSGVDAGSADTGGGDARPRDATTDSTVGDGDGGPKDGGADASTTYSVGGTVSGLAGTGLVLQNNGGDNLAVTASGTFTFAKKLTSGAPYAVTILTQPTSPAQTCTLANATGTIAAANVTNVAITCTTTKYTIGGTVSGLAAGGSVVLQNNGGDNVTVSANGAFTFPTSIASGATYAVTVKTQPATPVQTCSVTGGNGTVVAGNVTSVVVNCATNAFTVGGTITGLAGTVVLQNNGGNDVTLNATGNFAFSTPVASGATYAVTVKTQPQSPAQTCTVAGGTGTVGNANVTSVVVTCTTNKYQVGGTLSGLATNATVVLQNNAGDNVSLTQNGAFAFPTSVASGGTYAVTVLTQPAAPVQTCTVTSGTGAVAAADVTSVTVTCVTDKFTVGGTLSGLAVGASVVLQNNGADDLVLNANGAFTFPVSIASGSAFAVTVLTQPSSPVQQCIVSAGTGSVGSGNVTGVVVNCATDSFAVGGTISGLAGTVVLQNNLGDDLTLSANGTFAFPTPVQSGAPYAVTVKTQPSSPTQVCVVADGSGTVGSSNVTSVTVTCTTSVFAVGGTLAGLATGASVVLQNNAGDNLTLTQNGAFAFPTPVASSAGYNVTVLTQPASPVQSCVVTNGSGSVGASDVTGVTVTCTTTAYTIGGTVTGLAGTGLVLQDNGGDDLPINASGQFTFTTKVPSGNVYDVSVLMQPSGPVQNCVVSAGSGTVTNGNVTGVTINCTTNTYTIGGTITGLAGTVVLQNNGTDDLSLGAGSTSFAFTTPVASAAPYAVTVKTQPGSPVQDCTVTNGSGTVAGANVTGVTVTCVTKTYTVGGNVSGLTSGTLVLRNNGGDDLSLTTSGAFTFATAVPSSGPYAVTVATQPANGFCTVTSGSGTVTNANVTTVSVSCVFATGTTCNDIKTANPAATDGVYWINPGSGAGFFQVYCDMTTDGGGWTKILHYLNAAYTPTTAAAGTIAVAGTPAFAKLSDAQINAIGGTGASKVYRYQGDKTAQRLYVTSTATYADPARGMGLIGSVQACEAGTYPCTNAAINAGTTDSLAWGLVGNDCNRYFTDYFAAGQCYSTGSTTQRCFSAGNTCLTGHPMIGSFSLWVREFNYRTTVLASAPIAYFPLDEAASPVVDVIGGRSGAQSNGVTFRNAGVIPKGYSAGFAGSQKIDVPFDATLNPATFTVETWFSVAGGAGTYRSPVTSRDDLPQKGYIIYVNPSDQIEFWTGYGSFWSTVLGPAVTYGAKYHVVGTFTGGTMTLYVNGSLIGSLGGVAFQQNTARPLRIGAGATEGAGQYFFNGRVDEVAIYNKVLTAGEIAAHWAAGQ